MNSRKNDIEIIYSRLRQHLHGGNGFAINHFMQTPEHSLVKFVLGKGNRLKAMISAGIHGDEPSGVEAICSFLENNRFDNFSDEWELTFLPCLNPYGYEHGLRENHEGKDLNRLFKHESPPTEVRFAKSIFDSSYDLTIELHEDFMTPGYYLYQKGTHAEDDLLGKKILQAVKNIMPINLNGEIDGCSAQGGIIVQGNEPMDWWPMALYSLSKGTRRCLTLETATKLSMDARIEAHLVAIDTALNYFSRKK
ncbi:MAG: M14 family metallocarboxypeptidase [Nitrospina sp.]|nr:M14 family metallocarboxypeptidase [Nitrospina sp.]MBT3416181.1 M14 family metallocarboxypeptidase [Nitrospina sp.]MBT3855353.1 M14 family metallocarboxypeptidase [Nitrospina sp.]MBT4103979.1 M14 family metallocarboxypeptidase [Nitrospina sp.]MBT4390944.1 M14 family metallocarboxypeptidase [Nitrospina sp.]